MHVWASVKWSLALGPQVPSANAACFAVEPAVFARPHL